MSMKRSGQPVTLALIAAASLIFGMVLAGGLHLTRSGEAGDVRYVTSNRLPPLASPRASHEPPLAPPAGGSGRTAPSGRGRNNGERLVSERGPQEIRAIRFFY